MGQVSENTRPLFEIMQEKVDEVVKHYKTDFEYDQKIILKHLSSDKSYYWLLRESGTQLCFEKDLKVADSDWNNLYELEYFSDYKVKELYYVKIDKVVEDVVYGNIKKLDYKATIKKIKKEMQTPSCLKVSFDKKEALFSWDSFSSPAEALKMVANYFKKDDMNWNQLDYFDYVFLRRSEDGLQYNY